MKAFISCIGAVAVLSLSPVALSSGPKTAPSTFRSTNINRTAPIWLSAESAFDPAARELIASKFEPYEIEAIREHSARQKSSSETSSSNTGDRFPARCGESAFLEPAVEHNKTTNTFRDLSSTAGSIIRGKVTAVSPGFFEGIPSSLLTVNVGQVLKSDGSFDLTDDVYVVFPRATFSLDGITYCAVPQDPTLSVQEGDELLVFAVLGPIDSSRRLILPQASREIFAASGNSIHIPAHLRNDEDIRSCRTLDAISNRASLMSTPETHRRTDGAQ